MNRTLGIFIFLFFPCFLFAQFPDISALMGEKPKKDKFKLRHLITGHKYKHSEKDRSFKLNSPLSSINFNPVRGFHGALKGTFMEGSKNTKNHSLEAVVGYGFSDQKVNFKTSYQRIFDPMYKSGFRIASGREISDVHNIRTLYPIIESYFTLFFKENYVYHYENQFAEIAFFTEIKEDFKTAITLGYYSRLEIENKTNYSFFQRSENYIPNAKLNYQGKEFLDSDVFSLKLNLTWQPNTEFAVFKEVRINQGSTYPIVKFNVSTNVSTNFENYAFTTFTLSIKDQEALKSKMGYFSYSMTAGAIDIGNESYLHASDYLDYRTNEIYINSHFLDTDIFNTFPFYYYRTNQSYAESHIEYHFDGNLLGRLPGVKKLKWELYSRYSALAINDVDPLIHEVTVGVENIRLLGADLLRLECSFPINPTEVQSFNIGIRYNNFISKFL